MKKKKRKALRVILTVLFVIIIGGVLGGYFFGKAILKWGVESAASRALQVRVSIGDIGVSILEGKIGFKDLIIDNPPGYQHKTLLEVGNARTSLNLWSLLTNTVKIRQIAIDNVNLVIEQKNIISSNLNEVLETISQRQESAGTGPQDKTPKKTKKLHLDIVELTNITVNVKLLPIPGRADTITLELDPIRMTHFDSDDQLDTAMLTGQIIVALAAGVAKQGAGVLPKELTNSLAVTLDQINMVGQFIGEQGLRLFQNGTNATKGLIDGVNNLLRPKE